MVPEAKSGLGRRVLTAAVLIPMVVWCVLALPTAVVSVMFGIVVLGGAWEWTGLMGWSSQTGRWLYTLGFVPVLYAAQRAAELPAGPLFILALSLLWWLFALGWVLRFQQGLGIIAIRMTPSRKIPILAIAAGWLVLVPAWVALTFLHDRCADGPYLVMFFLALIWIADSGAYFTGRKWGATKLAPRVSPGKTWEGVGGACLAAGVFAAAAGLYADSRGAYLVAFVALSLATVPVSVLGDLVESLLKRQAGLKDSGRLLPGHGGVLDRVDSVTAAGPFFVLGLEWLRVMHG